MKDGDLYLWEYIIRMLIKMVYKIRDIDLNADTPDCKTPEEIIEAVLSYHKKIYPEVDLMPEINKLALSGMNLAQISYSMVKISYETSLEYAQKEIKTECEKIGLEHKRDMPDEDFDKLCDITEKHEHNYAVGHFMYLKWRSEELMVNTSFKIMESDPKIKKILAKDNADYNRIKQDWKKYPSISKQVINLAFKLRA